MGASGRRSLTRRSVVRGVGLAGASALTGALPVSKAFAQAKAPMQLSFWTYENPETRPWIHRRIKLFMEQNLNVKIEFQWFTFGDLGKKISVGFATGTAPDGFVSQDWFMPVWLAKGLLAPLDVQRLGYSSYGTYTADFTKAFVDGAAKDGKVYGYPAWFYGFCNYLNTKHFKEVGLDPDKDWPQSFEQFGEVAKRLTIKDGDKFVRQGFKFAMHTAQWTMIQFNPILIQCGGAWFDASGKCTVNSPAGVKAMLLRASIAKQYGAEDPAESIWTNPIPQMDWLKERCSMFWAQPQTLQTIASENPKMRSEGYFRPVQYPGVVAGKGFPTTYGFNLVINAHASREKQEVLHDLYRFIFSDPIDCWAATAPFTLARKSGWRDHATVRAFPDVDEIIRATDDGIFLPRTLVFNELADAMHRAVQKIMLTNADIKTALDDAAAEVDRATASYKG